MLSVRVTSEERKLLEVAAERAHMSVGEFARRKSIEAAVSDLLERSSVKIPVNDWQAFKDWVAQPAQSIPGVKALVGQTPTWES